MSTAPGRRRPGATSSRAPGAAMLLCLVTAACNASPPQAPQDAPWLTVQGPRPVAMLPLQRGYYVASDTPCAEASNATLLLLRRDGIGGARYFCEFRHIEQTGPATYRVEEACAGFQGDDAETRHLDYVIENDVRFVSRDQDGAVLDARYCAQSDLPADWRDTDIRSETE